MGASRNKAIVRVRRQPSTFATIDKRFLSDPRLSWKAKGLMTYLLAKPDDWKVIVEDLIKQSADGAAGVRSGIGELEAAGYMVRRKVIDRNTGQIKRWETLVYETPELAKEDDQHQPGLFEKYEEIKKPRLEQMQPDCGFPHVDNPHVENPHVENPHAGFSTCGKSNPTKNETTNNDFTENEETAEGEGGMMNDECGMRNEEKPVAAVLKSDPVVVAASHSGLSTQDSALPSVANTLALEGFTAGDAAKLASRTTAEQVQVAIANANALKRAGRLKNRCGYIRKAIDEKYPALPGAMSDEQRASNEARARERSIEQSRRVAADDQALAAERDAIDRAIGQLTDEQLAAHLAAVMHLIPERMRVGMTVQRARASPLVRMTVWREMQKAN